MVNTDLFIAKAQEIVEAGRFLNDRQWVPATSGNFSARLDVQHAALTESGRHKGRLTVDDILVVDQHGRAVEEGRKPSAETLLHTTLYQQFPYVGAVLHTHSVNATVLSRLTQAGSDLVLRDYEMQKALTGITTHEGEIRVPVFANTQDMTALSKDVLAMFEARDVHGYLIQGHGLYTWGRDMQETLRHIEAFEFLFACEILTRRLS